MPLFRRRKDATLPTPPTVDFWTWWEASGRGLDPTEPGRWVDELSDHAEAIHPSLSWHFTAGDRAEHRLVLSAGGEPEGRVQAERWLRLAQDGDTRWEYSASTPADTSALANSLEIDGVQLSLSELVFAVEADPDVRRVHVGVFHPAFPTISEGLRGQVSFLAVDWLLGEDAVERWVGALEPLAARPDPALPTSAVLEAVEGFDRERRENPGAWSILGGEHDGTPIFGLCRSDVRWVDAPHLDRGHQLTIRYAPAGPPDGEALDRITAIDDELAAAVGDAGIYLGRELIDGVATFFVYTDSEDRDVEGRLAALAESVHSELATAPDPGWRAARHLTH
ncbi:hypothetical protein ACT3TZ_11425 [Brachybacterium sp. AOP25-B2-12]|uniref:hypothetical protein n=1 Tax=Brachybacterium sp. AOP25-B2-12 TaxID=3457710 RepID=UPI0040345269